MTGKDAARLATAVLLGAAIALPVGMMIGTKGDAEAPPPSPSPSASARAVYSPKVLSDPYFLQEQRKGVEALERHCREAGKLCAEAREGRRWLEEHAG